MLSRIAQSVSGSELKKSPSNQSECSVSEKALWMVVATIFFDMIADSILSPVLAVYAKTDFDASTLQVGLLFSLPCASAFFSSGLLRKVMDQIGRRPMFIIGCLGLSIGAFCQALAQSYWTLLAGRTFSGIWMCLMTTAYVYINETTSGTTRSEWQGKMSAFSAAGALFGPGLGGGLSQYGLNIPSFATAFVELVAAFLGYLYLDESPSFTRRKCEAEVQSNRGGSASLSAAEVSKKAPRMADVGRSVYFFYFASAFTQSHQKLTQAIFPVFAMKKYGLRAIDIGFVFLVSALCTMASSWFTVKPLAKHLGSYRAGAFACVVQAVATLFIPFFPPYTGDAIVDTHTHKPLFISMVACFVVAQAATNLAMSFEGAISGSIGDPADQAKIQAGALRWRMAGKVVAPVVGAYLLEKNMWYPWFLGAFAALSAAPFCLALEQTIDKPDLQRKTSLYGAEWKDEVGSRQDMVELGEIMAEMLTRKHYKWVSNKEEVWKYLEHVLPVLPTHDREAYHEALEDTHHMRFGFSDTRSNH